MTGPNTDRDRGQTITLEAVTGALILLSVMLFAFQATAITPLTSSTSNQLVEEQNRELADDILDVAAENGSLSYSVRYYDTGNDEFVNAPMGLTAYANGGPPTAFGNLLETTFGSRNTAFNVYVQFRGKDGSGNWQTEEIQMVSQGTPSDNAVAASKSMILYDDMPITHSSNSNTIKTDSNFYIDDDLYPSGPVYNVVRVRIVVWKI